MKTVGLVAAKGEGGRIMHCLRALSRIVDEIVYLDDNSPDDTLERVYQVQDECGVVRIIESHLPERDEARDRNELLRAGREIGGDRFLVLDADEAFAANADYYLHVAMEALVPGEAISVPWTHLWRSASVYRVDPCPWVNNWRVVGFCDDGTSWYPNVWLHTPRQPIKNAVIQKLPAEIVFLHFQFVAWPNVLIKQSWYKYLERIHGKAQLNDYNLALDERNLKVEASKPEWFHDFFDEDAFADLYAWRIKEMQTWKKQHGPELFTGLSACPHVD
jgi:glycosyltransferase involved in cell wall biosynthesis